MSWTVAQCDEKLAQLREALDELVLLPVRGSTGRTSIDLGGKKAELEDMIETWEMRRAAALNGGRALRTRRTC